MAAFIVEMINKLPVWENIVDNSPYRIILGLIRREIGNFVKLALCDKNQRRGLDLLASSEIVLGIHQPG